MTATETSMPAGPAVPLVGKKYMKQLGAMVNENAASAMSAFARKQMEKMGWSEGKGLGKDEQGVTTYVRVKKREESMGIGVEAVKVQEQQNQWWYNVYDKLADKIKIAADSDDEGAADGAKKKSKKKDKKKSKKKSKKRARSDSDSDDDDDSAEDGEKKAAKKFRIPTDEELFAATGGKLFGRRAYGSCVGKLKRDELLVKGKLAGSSASSAATSSGDESASDATAEKKEKKEKKKKSKKDKSSKSE